MQSHPAPRARRSVLTNARCSIANPHYASSMMNRFPKDIVFEQGQVETLNDLTPNMVLEGVVTNVAAFGAFVDIGVTSDGSRSGSRPTRLMGLAVSSAGWSAAGSRHTSQCATPASGMTVPSRAATFAGTNDVASTSAQTTRCCTLRAQSTTAPCFVIVLPSSTAVSVHSRRSAVPTCLRDKFLAIFMRTHFCRSRLLGTVEQNERSGVRNRSGRWHPQQIPRP